MINEFFVAQTSTKLDVLQQLFNACGQAITLKSLFHLSGFLNRGRFKTFFVIIQVQLVNSPCGAVVCLETD